MLRPQSVSDRIGHFNPAQVRGPSYLVIDRVQGLDPAIQITAIAVALCAMCEAIGRDMRDVITVAENTLADCEGPFTEHIQAIRAYAEGEILRKGD